MIRYIFGFAIFICLLKCDVSRNTNRSTSRFNDSEKFRFISKYLENVFPIESNSVNIDFLYMKDHPWDSSYMVIVKGTKCYYVQLADTLHRTFLAFEPYDDESLHYMCKSFLIDSADLKLLINDFPKIELEYSDDMIIFDPVVYILSQGMDTLIVKSSVNNLNYEVERYDQTIKAILNKSDHH